ncbi:hypothetical protein DRN34_01465 [Thermococci archaeon]|nr:MAG: hypothetical protein DRN34_01465 [Thermococci archaeon]
MKKVYGVVWNGSSSHYVYGTLYTDKNKAQRIAEKTTAKIHWLRRRLLGLKYYVREFELEEE